MKIYRYWVLEKASWGFNLSGRGRGNMNSLIFTALIVLTFSGCATSFSGVPGYRDYVRKEISLLKPVNLTEAKNDIPRSSRYLNPRYVEIPSGSLYLMGNLRTAESQGIELPAGTRLNIQEIVCQAVSGDTLEVQARGTVFVPALGREVNFLYVYAYEDQCVRRAPWEGEQLPLWRKFDTGRVEWCEKSSQYFEKKYQ
jgi:hypothetical protein